MIAIIKKVDDFRNKKRKWKARQSLSRADERGLHDKRKLTFDRSQKKSFSSLSHSTLFMKSSNKMLCQFHFRKRFFVRVRAAAFFCCVRKTEAPAEKLMLIRCRTLSRICLHCSVHNARDVWRPRREELEQQNYLFMALNTLFAFLFCSSSIDFFLLSSDDSRLARAPLAAPPHKLIHLLSKNVVWLSTWYKLYFSSRIEKEFYVNILFYYLFFPIKKKTFCVKTIVNLPGMISRVKVHRE